MTFIVIHKDVLEQIEAMSVVTHVATGTVRESPLYKSTGKEGDRHYLAYPAGPTVKKAKNAFLQQRAPSLKAPLYWGEEEEWKHTAQFAPDVGSSPSGALLFRRNRR